MELSITKQIDVVEGITRREFEENYYFPQKPVVLKGLMQPHKANNWSLDYFKCTMGETEVGIFDAELEKMDRSYKEPDYYMSFRDFLSEIQQGPTKKRLFLFNPFKHNRELLNDFEFPKLCGGFLKSFPFMFFGGDGSITRIHQDMDMSCVFLTQFEGKKRVVLFDPKFSNLLYRLPFNVHTTVDITNPDYNKYPGLRYVEGMETILEFGDTIFMPSGWWHHIEYIGSGFGMSMRCVSPHIKDIAKGAWNVGVNTNIDDLLRKIAGDAWYQYKVKKAHDRAEVELTRMAHLGKVA
ncbi:MAG: cupin-like domain-containing protein [Cyclobacteriaceae bacterium]